SRRLGRSLGVDLVPFKTCTFDCIYCQLGKTTDKRMDRKTFFAPRDIIKDVLRRLKEIPRPDYITLSGSGEPTLYSPIEEIISGIKKTTDIPVVLLTNGSLFWIDEIRAAVKEADLIIPSLDAGDKNIFAYVNRPHSGISFEKTVEGLCRLRETYKNPIWLEVFLIGGVTDIRGEILKIKKWADCIAPDRIQLNTAVRIPAEGFVDMVGKEKMEELRSLFGKKCEVIADYSKVHSVGEFRRTQEDVLDLLKRRPCSVDDISDGLNLHRNETAKYVQELMDRHLIKREMRGNRVLFFAH
ncbi:MAG: radical SAM protein, partial [Syntrophales bacterium]|nr:radical SAM protein [Syntrophales bacterium]